MQQAPVYQDASRRPSMLPSMVVIRRDVERALDVYLESEHDARASQIGRMVIDDSRLGAELSGDQERIHRAAWSRRTRRKGLGRTVLPGGTNEAMVESTGRHGWSSPSTWMLEWRGTIGSKLNAVETAHKAMLLRGASLRCELRRIDSHVAELNHQLGSPSRSQAIRHRRAEVRKLRDAADTVHQAVRSRWRRLYNTKAYELALIMFWLVCDDSPENRAYCFMERPER